MQSGDVWQRHHHAAGKDTSHHHSSHTESLFTLLTSSQSLAVLTLLDPFDFTNSSWSYWSVAAVSKRIRWRDFHPAALSTQKAASVYLLSSPCSSCFLFDSCVCVSVQAGASMMDPNHFLMIVLSRFELFHIFSSADCRKRYREANKVITDSTCTPVMLFDSLLTSSVCLWQDVVQQNNTLIEEMLHLIIMVVCESLCCNIYMKNTQEGKQEVSFSTAKLTVFHVCVLRWAVRAGCRPGGAFWWGQERNHPPAVNQTDGSQWAGQGFTWECKTLTCLSFFSSALNFSQWLYPPIILHTQLDSDLWLFLPFRETRRPV